MVSGMVFRREWLRGDKQAMISTLENNKKQKEGDLITNPQEQSHILGANSVERTSLKRQMRNTQADC